MSSKLPSPKIFVRRTETRPGIVRLEIRYIYYEAIDDLKKLAPAEIQYHMENRELRGVDGAYVPNCAYVPNGGITTQLIPEWSKNNSSPYNYLNIQMLVNDPPLTRQTIQKISQEPTHFFQNPGTIPDSRNQFNAFPLPNQQQSIAFNEAKGFDETNVHQNYVTHLPSYPHTSFYQQPTTQTFFGQFPDTNSYDKSNVGMQQTLPSYWKVPPLNFQTLAYWNQQQSVFPIFDHPNDPSNHQTTLIRPATNSSTDTSGSPKESNHLEIKRFKNKIQKERKPRKHFSEEEVNKLIGYFDRFNKYINTAERENIAKKLNLEVDQVKVWFQNRRAAYLRKKNQAQINS